MNFEMHGGGKKIWADGYHIADDAILDSKFIEKPAQSPFIEGSNIPDHTRNLITNDIEDEMIRYAAVVNDPSTPARSLRIITNDARAVPYFEKLMIKHGVPGEVIVQP